LKRDIGNEFNRKFQWSWLRQGNLDKETEGFIMAAQEQALTKEQDPSSACVPSLSAMSFL